MKKTIGYYLFSFVYYICRPLPVIKNRVMCIATHEEGEGSNVSLTVQALKKVSSQYTFTYITKSSTGAVKSMSGIKSVITFFLQKPYELVRAEYVLMDNVFMPYAYCRRKKATKVIQLWHGTGTIKKFGQDSNTGKLKELEKRANRNITHLIVNSHEMKELYSSAFGVSKELIYPIGLPKTDELVRRINNLKETGRNQDRSHIYQKYNLSEERQLILYAPTFRDDEINNPKVLEKLQEMLTKIPEEYYIGLRLHPFIAKSCPDMIVQDRVLQFSYESDLNTLLMASDYLITDYSSIIFEYCLLERPMIFYAYDYESFSSNGRGFYKKYSDYVPGEIAYTADELGVIFQAQKWDIENVQRFKERNYEHLDGKATERLLNTICKKSIHHIIKK